jgi:hypothetical protein
VNSDESLELQELSLDLHSTNLEMKRSLFLSLIESSSRSEEGSGGQEVSPELLNKAFSHTIICIEIAKKSLTAPCFNVYTKYVVVIDTRLP